MVRRTVFIVNFVATLFILGVVWSLQVVHFPLYYPSLEFIPIDQFNQYLTSQSRTILISLPFLALELLTSIILLISPPYPHLRSGLRWAFFILVVIWITNFIIQVPIRVLDKGYHIDAYRILVSINWVRTICWSLRAFILVIIAYRLFNRDLNPEPEKLNP